MMTDGYNNVDQYPDGYMEQEEEWEREGLLDPAWEKQQKKVGLPGWYCKHPSITSKRASWVFRASRLINT